jgi:hypothetical protein
MHQLGDAIVFVGGAHGRLALLPTGQRRPHVEVLLADRFVLRQRVLLLADVRQQRLAPGGKVIYAPPSIFSL